MIVGNEHYSYHSCDIASDNVGFIAAPSHGVAFADKLAPTTVVADVVAYAADCCSCYCCSCG